MTENKGQRRLRAEYGEDGLGVDALVASLASAGARQIGLCRRVLMAKLPRAGRTVLMQSLTEDHLQGFEVESSGAAPFGENHSLERVYFRATS